MSLFKRVAVIIFTLCLFHAWPCFAAISVGDKAPEFSINGLFRKTYSLKSLTNKAPLLLVFGRADNEKFDAILKELIPFHKEAENLSILCIMVKAGQRKTLYYTKRSRATFPIIGDSSGEIAIKYKISYIPTYFWIDKNGVVKRRGAGGTARDFMNMFRTIFPEDWAKFHGE